MGVGKIETPNNSGNDNSAMPMINSTLPGNYFNDCSAIQACADLASVRSFSYYSFDIHWRSDTGNWECIQYYDPNTDVAAFNVTMKKAYVTYGFYNPDF